MIKELIILAQVANTIPPADIMRNDTPTYSWERPTQPPRYQVPATGIYSAGSRPPPISFEEVEVE